MHAYITWLGRGAQHFSAQVGPNYLPKIPTFLPTYLEQRDNLFCFGLAGVEKVGYRTTV